MAQPIFDLLRSYHGRPAVVVGSGNGTRSVPEVIVPLQSKASTEIAPFAAMQPIQVGSRVRLTRAPYLGLVGQVIVAAADAPGDLDRHMGGWSRSAAAQWSEGVRAPGEYGVVRMSHMSPPDENRRRLVASLGILLLFVSFVLLLTALTRNLVVRSREGRDVVADVLSRMGIVVVTPTAQPVVEAEIAQSASPTLSPTAIAVLLPTRETTARPQRAL